MDLLPTDEQDEIVVTIRSVLADHHRLGEPLDDALWRAAAEQGWFGLGLAADLGGVGYSLAEEALLVFELGRAVVPGPFLWTIVAADIAARSGDDVLATSLIDGSRRSAWCEPAETGAVLLDAHEASVAVGTSPDDDGLALWSIDGIDSVELVSLDELVSLRRTPELPSPVATGGPISRRRFDVLLAAQLAGLATAATEQSVGYAQDREQFGQPIGGFQAVKHRCADMAVRADAATMAVRFAALAVRDERPDAGFHASAARIVATSAAVEAAQANVQNHGGIGFTWEHTAHRIVTRARVLSTLAGGAYAAMGSMLAEPSPG